MSLQKKILKGSFIVTAGEGVSYTASFVRNMILARILTKADFGIAASFALAISALEFTGKMSIGQLVIQSKEGDEPAFLATAQLAQFLVALVSSFFLFFLATPLSSLFGLTGRPDTFRVLCLVPLCKGLENLEVRRMARDLRFLPSVVIEVIPQILITAAVWPLARLLPDYRLVLALLVAKAAMTCLGAHLYAGWRYRWAWQKRYVTMIWRFGWPLVINGLLVVAILQGDRFFVAGFYSLGDLAVYSAAALLTLVPGMIFCQTMGSVMLPVMARVQDDPEQFRRRYRLIVQTASLFSVIYLCVGALGGEALMLSVYGKKYAGGGLLLAWFAVANAFRLIRVAPALAALAKGDPKNQTLANVFRATAFGLAFFAGYAGMPLWTLAAAGLVGEALAFAASVGFLSRRVKVPSLDTIIPTSVVGLAAVFSGLGVHLGIQRLHPVASLSVGFGLALIMAVISILSFHELRRTLAGMWHQHVASRWPVWTLGGPKPSNSIVPMAPPKS